MHFSFNDPSVSIAIVGAGGFIGSHLVDALVERTTWRIFAVDLNFERLQHRLHHERVDFLCGDLKNEDVALRIAACPIVINLAAICVPSRYMLETKEVIESNYNHPVSLALACEKSGSWLIHFSTSEVYGRTSAEPCLLQEDSSPMTLGPIGASRWSYACAKQLAERYIASLENLSWTVLRPFNFIGPRMDFMPGVDGEGIPRVLANFCSALLRDKPLLLVDGGLSRRSFTSIHDAIHFIFAVLAHPDKSNRQAFNIGNPNNELSIDALATLMRSIYASLRGVSLEEVSSVQNVDAKVYYGEGYEDSLRRIPSIEKSERLLGYTPKEPLETTLKETLSWFMDHYGLVL